MLPATALVRPQPCSEKQRNNYNYDPKQHFYYAAFTHAAVLPAAYLLWRILGGQRKGGNLSVAHPLQGAIEGE